MAFLPAALAPGTWTMLPCRTAARVCPRVVARQRPVRVLSVLPQLLGQLFDLTGQLGDERHQLCELGIALCELGVAGFQSAAPSSASAALLQ